ncbi:MAG: hypothetical protein GTN53_29510, partial [Candidatus Aminicenantes bacterium]|nr:hypothetical protein [Candidatus Aenigmarchaeota archaeon]NIO84672.1 hypothetical protein [Candidatus Aminicenantes bacterium]NIQ70613.1 hypothetical protein [Candidatus Aminicenantes bacterium]NIT26653.1 hypothetical protein [Candidatus Aminicenantes bacterium]
MRSILSFLLPLLLAMTFIYCGDFKGIGDGGIQVTETTLSGRSSKGPIFGANIDIFALNSDGSTGDLLATATTDSEARYEANLGGYSGPVLIILNDGQYQDEATGQIIQNTTTLHAALQNASGKVSVMVTPLTELAYRNAGILTPANINSSNISISMLFGIDILSIEPVDPSDSTEAASASQAQKDYSLILAAISELSHSTGMSISEILVDMEADIVDGILDSMASELITSLGNFLGKGNNNTGIFDLADTGLDESINNGGMNYSGIWNDTAGDAGEFTFSIIETGNSFDGTYFSIKQTNGGGTETYSISGTLTGNSYEGTDSQGREFLFELKQHPLDNSDSILEGSYLDTAKGKKGSIRSTNNNGYNSISGLVEIEGSSDDSGAIVTLREDSSFTTSTNKHGKYFLRGFSNGSYNVVASKSGYQRNATGPWNFSDGKTHYRQANFSLSETVLNPPVANAGANRTVDEGTPVTLNGTGSS